MVKIFNRLFSKLPKAFISCKDLLKDNLMCPKCNKLQPFMQRTYFNVLSDDKVIDIDQKALRDNYIKLQDKYHPDKLAGQEDSEEVSAWLNKAYHTLKDPFQRYSYFLNLKGINIEEGDTICDSDFFLRVMETREEIEENAEIGNTVRLEQIKLDTENQVKELKKDIKSILQSETRWDMFSVVDKVKSLMVKWKYLDGIIAAINEELLNLL